MNVIALAGVSVAEFTIFKDSDINSIFTAAGDICNRINVDILSSKIGKEEDMGVIGYFMKIVNLLNPELRDELQKGGWLK